jgi:hypothetical protein
MTTTDDGLFNAVDLPPAAGYRLEVVRQGFRDWTSESFQVITGRTWDFKISLTALPAAGRGAPAPEAPAGLPAVPAPAPRAATAPQPTGPRAGGVISPAAPQSLTRMETLAQAPTQPAPPASGRQSAAVPAQSGAPAAAALPPQPLKENIGDSDAGLINAAQLEDLPGKTRWLDELAVLMPSVSVDNASGALAFLGVPSSYSLLVDGVTINGMFNWDKNTTARRFSEDAMRDVQVLTGVAPPEFGRTNGGFVNAATRSGSNALHGDAYGFLYKPGLSSIGRYAEGKQLLQSDEQGGASAGGPIVPNKLFLFANYEARSGRSQDLNRIINPLISDSAGLAVLASNCKAAALCTAADKFIQSQMNVLVEANWHSETALAKADLRLGARNAFTFEANAMNGVFPNGFQMGSVASNSGLLGNGATKQESRFAKLGWISVPTVATVNELRLGFTQDYLAEGASTPGLSTGLLGIFVAGTPVGASNTYPSAYRERRLQLVDNASLVSGSHVIKIGGDLSRTFDRLNSLENYAGTYSYASLTAFAQDFTGAGQKNYVDFTQQFGTPAQSLQYKRYIVYAEDTWRVAPRVTLDFGVRWDKPRLSQPVITAPYYYETSVIRSTNTDLAPRVGAAIKVTNTTTLRGGFGMFYDPTHGELLDALFLGNSLYQTHIWANPNQSGAPAFPKAVTSSTIPGGTSDIFESGAKLRDAEAKRSTFSLERRWNNTTVTLSAVHDPGFGLWSDSDLNLVAPTTVGKYTIDNSSGQVVTTFSTPIYTTKADPNRAHVFSVANSGSSWYDAAALDVRSRLAYGLSLRAHYEWSHSIDDVGGPPGMGLVPENVTPGGYLSDKGNSASDQRHRGSIDWVWQPAPLGNNSLLARYLVNGWQLSGVAFFSSPEAATAMVIAGGQQISGVSMAYTNSLNGSGGWARVPFYGVGTLRTGYQYQVNARLTRTLPFTERVKGALMFEAFNLLNHQYDTGVNTVAYTVSAGVLRPVAGLGAGNASQAYPGGVMVRSFRVAFRLTF